MPAQLTRMRAAPCAASALATAAVAEASSPTSQTTATPPIALATSSAAAAIEIGDRHLRAPGRQRLGRRPAEPRAPARHDRRRSGNFHCACPPRLCACFARAHSNGRRFRPEGTLKSVEGRARRPAIRAAPRPSEREPRPVGESVDQLVGLHPDRPLGGRRARILGAHPAPPVDHADLARRNGDHASVAAGKTDRPGGMSTIRPSRPCIPVEPAGMGVMRPSEPSSAADPAGTATMRPSRP